MIHIDKEYLDLLLSENHQLQETLRNDQIESEKLVRDLQKKLNESKDRMSEIIEQCDSYYHKLNIEKKEREKLEEKYRVSQEYASMLPSLEECDRIQLRYEEACEVIDIYKDRLVEATREKYNKMEIISDLSVSLKECKCGSIKNYETLIEENNDKASLLKREIENNDKLEKIAKTNEEQRKYIQNLESDLLQHQRMVEDLKSTKSQINDPSDCGYNKLTVLERFNMDMKLGCIQTELQEMEKENIRLHEKYSNNDEVTKLKCEITKLQFKLTDQKIEINQLKEKNRNNNKKLEEFQRHVFEMETEIENLTHQITDNDNKETEIKSLKCENADKDNKIAEIELDLSDKQSEIRRLVDENDEKTKEITKMKTSHEVELDELRLKLKSMHKITVADVGDAEVQEELATNQIIFLDQLKSNMNSLDYVTDCLVRLYKSEPMDLIPPDKNTVYGSCNEILFGNSEWLERQIQTMELMNKNIKEIQSRIDEKYMLIIQKDCRRMKLRNI